MAKRAKTDIADVGLRLREALRAQIERAARQRGVSMNAEIVSRLEDSFRVDDLIGGPEMRDTARLMIASFNALGGAYDDFVGLDWRRDRACYLNAVLTVAENLMVAAPGGPPAPGEADTTIDMLTERLKSRLKSHWETYAASRKAAGQKEEGGDA